MVQRIQSLYLLMTTVFSVLFLNGSIINFADKTNKALTINFGGINKVLENSHFELIEKLVPLSVLLIIIPALSFITIFLFKRRRLQMRLIKGLIGLIVVLMCASAYYIFYVIRNFNAEMLPGINLFLLLLMLVSSYLAYRGVKKDDDLVKSYDRLR